MTPAQTTFHKHDCHFQVTMADPVKMELLKRGMKWYCSPFPFGSFCVFVKLCQIAEPEPCAVGANMCVFVCVCVCVRDGQTEREGENIYAKM